MRRGGAAWRGKLQTSCFLETLHLPSPSAGLPSPYPVVIAGVAKSTRPRHITEGQFSLGISWQASNEVGRVARLEREQERGGRAGYPNSPSPGGPPAQRREKRAHPRAYGPPPHWAGALSAPPSPHLLSLRQAHTRQIAGGVCLFLFSCTTRARQSLAWLEGSLFEGAKTESKMDFTILHAARADTALLLALHPIIATHRCCCGWPVLCLLREELAPRSNDALAAAEITERAAWRACRPL